MKIFRRLALGALLAAALPLATLAQVPGVGAPMVPNSSGSGGSATPSGPAGGSLKGTYPNPGLADVNQIGTSLAIGGCTISTNALCVTGATALGNTSIGAGSAITSSGPGGALGSNAFTSTAYLPLTGGTLTGTLTINPAANTNALAVTGFSLTGTNTQSMLDLSGTWNIGSTLPGAAIKLNMTDTASASASLLMDLQVGSASKLNVNKAGLISSGASFAPTIELGQTSTGIVLIGRTGNAGQSFIGFGYDGTAPSYTMASNGYIRWSNSTTNAIGSTNTTLFSDAANTLALRNGATAQTLRVYGQWIDINNGDWISFTKAAGGTATIATVKNGTGTAANLTFTTGSSGNLLTLAPGGSSTSNGVLSLGTTADSNSEGFSFGFGGGLGIGIGLYSGNPGIYMASGYVLAWGNQGFSQTSDLFIRRAGAASLQHGATDVDLNSSIVAQTIRFQGALVGGTSNQAGKDATFIASPGKGTGAYGGFLFQLAPAGSTGTAIASPVTGFAITQTTPNKFISWGSGLSASAGTSSGYTIFDNPGNGFIFGDSTGNAYPNYVTAAYGVLASYGTIIKGTSAYGWSSTTDLGSGSIDTRMSRMGAAGRVGLIGGTAGATAANLDIYGISDVTGGTPSNYSRLSQTMAAGVGTFDIQTGGSGAANVGYAFKVGGTTKLDYGSTTAGAWSIVAPVNFYVGATPFGIFDTNGDFVVASNSNFGASSSGGLNTQDTSFSRSSAGVWQMGTGTSNNALGSLILTNITATGAAVILSGLASDAATTDSTVCVKSSDGTILKGSGTLGICLGTSSARYKSDIQPITVGLSEIMALPVKSFYLDKKHGNPSKLMYGFTAEDCAKVLPVLAGMDIDARPNTCDYLGVVPVLVRAIQQQQAKIEQLERRAIMTVPDDAWNPLSNPRNWIYLPASQYN